MDALLDGQGNVLPGFGRGSKPKTDGEPAEGEAAPRFKTPADKENVACANSSASSSDAADGSATRSDAPLEHVHDLAALDKKKKPATKPEGTESHNVTAARRVLNIFEEVYPRWQALVAAEPENADFSRQGLQRFHPGFSLTRIVAKGTYALGVLKDHAREARVLEELLAQRHWRRARRGRWYDRLALIYMTYLGDPKKARKAVEEGLRDPDTHISSLVASSSPCLTHSALQSFDPPSNAA